MTTQQSTRPYYVAPNLINQNFTAAAPNKVWVGDITYVPTAQGWLYVATVIDLRPLHEPAPQRHSNISKFEG